MRLFAEVKMRSERVLEEMHHQVAEQHVHRRARAGERGAFGDHLQQRRRQHEARAERDEIFQVAAVPVLLDDDESSESVRDGGGESKHQAQDDRIHLSPPIRSPMPPRIEPSSMRFPPARGAAAKMRSARRLKGSDCRYTLPGPLNVAKNSPSPPNKVFLNPPTNWMS